MQTERINDWETKKQKLKKEYPELTIEDLTYEIGKEEELLERLQKKMSKNKKEIRNWLSLMG
ncbi:MAG: general stress protein CsbD [Ferruginibacter sp.]